MHCRHHMVESCIVTKLIVANISLVSEFSAVVQPTCAKLKAFCDPLCVAGGPALGCNPVVKNHLYCIMLLVQCWVCVYRAGGDKWWTVFMFVLPPYLLPFRYFPLNDFLLFNLRPESFYPLICGVCWGQSCSPDCEAPGSPAASLRPRVSAGGHWVGGLVNWTGWRCPAVCRIQTYSVDSMDIMDWDTEKQWSELNNAGC